MSVPPLGNPPQLGCGALRAAPSPVQRDRDPLIYPLYPCAPSVSTLQHAGDAQILVEVRPVNAHGHDLEVRALFGGRTLEPRVPFEGRRDLAAVRKGHDQLALRELDLSCFQVADLNFQSSHPRLPAALLDVTAGGE